MRQTALDLCNREANQNKQVILFVPTKTGCERMVSGLLGFVDEAYAGRGVLGGSFQRAFSAGGSAWWQWRVTDRS